MPKKTSRHKKKEKNAYSNTAKIAIASTSFREPAILDHNKAK